MPSRRDATVTIEDDARALIAQKKPTKPRDRSWDAKRHRQTYDLAPQIIEDVNRITGELQRTFGSDVRVSDVAAMLLQASIKRYDAGQLEIKASPRQVNLVLVD